MQPEKENAVSSNDSIRDLMSRAHRLLANGDTAGARVLAQQAYTLDKTNPDVLVLVSKIIPDPLKQRNVLKRALQIDPKHREARQRLADLDGPPILPLPPSGQRIPRVVMGGVVAGVIVFALLLVLVLPRLSSPPLPTTLSNTLASTQMQIANVPSPTVKSVLPSATTFVTATAAPSPTLTLSATASVTHTPQATDGGAPVVLTATALQQQFDLTIRALTQTAQAVQQAGAGGTLGAQIAQTQTLVALSNALPGTIVVRDTNQYHLLNLKLKFLGLTGTYKNQEATVELAPDAQHIVYETGNLRNEWHLTDAEGQHDQPIEIASQGDRRPWFGGWSPDSHEFIYVDGKGLLLAAVDGSAPRLLVKASSALDFITSNINPFYLPMWSPDQQRIVFHSGSSEIYTLNLQAGVTTLQTIANQAGINTVAWLPDNQRLLVVTGSTLAAMKFDGSDVHTLFADKPVLGSIAVSPDSKHIAFISGNGTLETRLAAKQIGLTLVIGDFDSGASHTLPLETLEFNTPVSFNWSPDSTHLVFLVLQQPYAYLMVSADGSKLHPIPTGTLWSPDSRFIIGVVGNAQNNTDKTVLVPADGSAPITLVDKALSIVAWLP